MADEGGYANNPNDRGGETYRGISRRWHPDWGGWPLIDSVKTKVGSMPPYRTIPYFNWTKRLNAILSGNAALNSAVNSFYATEMWCPAYDNLNSQDLVNWLFSHTVNISPVMGPQHNKSIVHRWLQCALGLQCDGVLGPKTVKAANSCSDAPGLIRKMQEDAKSYYTLLVEKDPSQRQFLKGWLSRI